MNKADLVAKVASKTGLTKKAAQDAMEALMEAVMVAVSKGDSVTLTGFGTYKASKRAARNGRNPQSGQVIKIPARTVPVFRPGKEFKEMVK
ncbi:MAG TPA: HU family DNA-binding protein [Candidatus Dojkabacteria bacterium]|jgi:DNA-binding protein HU-beta|nr:HU family DNA-binding protein [Candidatus Dojkabacteria bacterium]HRP36303.1 HU family DNA-binding protein [Candidatus Dojkabacteria bacterium]HRP51061.1 HU family DNA-binding protein [Candidatus Dojkabacteria bacterium]